MKTINILEFVTSSLVIVTLFLIPLDNKWWLAYAANSLLFAGVSWYKKAPWFAAMGLCLCLTAIKNYCY